MFLEKCSRKSGNPYIMTWDMSFFQDTFFKKAPAHREGPGPGPGPCPLGGAWAHGPIYGPNMGLIWSHMGSIWPNMDPYKSNMDSYGYKLHPYLTKWIALHAPGTPGPPSVPTGSLVPRLRNPVYIGIYICKYCACTHPTSTHPH